MFVIASGSVGGGSPDRNAHIADANQPGTTNFNGVFRVTLYLGASQTQNLMCRAEKHCSEQGECSCCGIGMLRLGAGNLRPGISDLDVWLAHRTLLMRLTQRIRLRSKSV
jgi:hypothetical protein